MAQQPQTGAPTPRPVPVLYVGGLGRSGSTVFERLVGEATGYVGLGELVHLWERGVGDDELCGCSAPFSSCPYWSAVGERAFGGWNRLDLAGVRRLAAQVDRTRWIVHLWAASRRRGFGEARLSYLSVLTALYEACVDVAGAPGVIDSSKHASTAHLLAGASGVRLIVVQVVRDSPAVAFSWSRTVRRPQADDRVDYMARYSPARASIQWLLQNGLVELLRLRGVPVHLLRYEDLVRSPETEMRRVTDFLRSSDLAPVGDSQTRAADLMAHGISGNPGRFGKAPFRLRVDDEWRTRMPRRARVLVSVVTAPLRWHYGYLGHPRSRRGLARHGSARSEELDAHGRERDDASPR